MNNTEKYIELSDAAEYTFDLDDGVEADDMWHLNELIGSESKHLASDMRAIQIMAERYKPGDTIYGEGMAAEKAQLFLGALHEYRDKLVTVANHVLQKRLGLFVVHAAVDYEVVSGVTFGPSGLVANNPKVRSRHWYVDKAFMTDEERGVIRKGGM